MHTTMVILQVATCSLRVSKDGKYVVADSVHDKKHRMVVLKLKYQC